MELAQLGEGAAHLPGPHAAVAHDRHHGMQLAGDPVPVLLRHRRRQGDEHDVARAGGEGVLHVVDADEDVGSFDGSSGRQDEEVGH